MSPTCRLKWKSILSSAHIPISVWWPIISLFRLYRTQVSCSVWLLFGELFKMSAFVPFILHPLSSSPVFPVFWLHKFIINCFKASRCLSAFCLEFIQRNRDRDTISSCGFPFGFPLHARFPKMLFVCRLCCPYDDFLNRFSN